MTREASFSLLTVRLAALALVVVAAVWSLQYPFWPNRLSLLDQGKIVDYSWVAFVLFLGGIGLWVWALWVLLPSLRGTRLAAVAPLVGGTTILVYAAFVLMYPTNAIDVYIYAVRSRLLTTYGENPNAALPVDYWETDPYMRFASQEWADNTSPYGPLWNQLAAPITAISGDNIGLAVIGFKLLSVAAILLTGWCIYDIVNHRWPEWALPAALFWLWNPLVLWDGIGNAHNDVTLMLPAVAALWAWTRRHDNLVLPLLIGSVLIKYVTVLLVPLAVVALLRRNPSWAARLEGALWTLGATMFWLGLSLYPFYDLGAMVDSAREQEARISFSLAWWVMATSSRVGLADLDADTIRNAAYAIVALGLAVAAWRTWHKPERLPRAAFEVVFLFMLVASTNQRGWYVIWLVPLAALLIPDRPWRRALVWSVTSLAGHAASIWLWYVWDWDAWDRYWYTNIIVGLVFIPVLVVTAWDLLPRGRPQGNQPDSATITRSRPVQTSPR